MPTIKFVNEKVTAEAHEGEDIRTVARKNGVQLYSGPHKILNCMGFGQCCSCNVIVRSGAENCTKRSIFEKIGKWINPLLGLAMLNHPDKEVRLKYPDEGGSATLKSKRIRRSTGTARSSGTDSGELSPGFSIASAPINHHTLDIYQL